MYVPSSCPPYGWMLNMLNGVFCSLLFYLSSHICVYFFKVRSDILRCISTNICHLFMQTSSFERNSEKRGSAEVAEAWGTGSLDSLWILPLALCSVPVRNAGLSSPTSGEGQWKIRFCSPFRISLMSSQRPQLPG